MVHKISWHNTGLICVKYIFIASYLVNALILMLVLLYSSIKIHENLSYRFCHV